MAEETTNEDLDTLDDIDEEAEDTKGEEGKDQKGTAGEKGLDLILDIPLTVAVELGRSKMLINDLLQLGQGSVIELTKLVALKKLRLFGPGFTDAGVGIGIKWCRRRRVKTCCGSCGAEGAVPVRNVHQ